MALLPATMPAATQAVQITLVGAPAWQGPGLPRKPLAPQDAALFALLALDGPLPRDRVAAWLWPHSPRAQANSSLRQRLFRLRQSCGHPLLRAGLTLELLPAVDVDIRANPPPGRGELLGGFDYGEYEALDAWVAAARETLSRRRLDALAALASRLEARGALAQALTVAERIVTAEPAREHAWRRLMRLHYLRGDRAAAVQAFERFEREVCREHGLRPTAETLALLDMVERAEIAAPALRGPLPAALLRPPQLVGRAPALAALAMAWASGHAALVFGEGGVGKSRLLEDFVHGRHGVVLARARPGDAAMPYATLAALLAAVVERFVPTLSDAVRAELARIVMALGPPAAAPAQQATLWQAVESALGAAVANGLAAVVIDDLHWADTASLELLRWLLASAALQPLRLAFAARPDEAGPAAELLRRWPGDSLRVESVGLSPLTPEGVLELVRSCAPALAGLADDEALAEALFRYTGGHVFYILETLKAMVRAGPDAAAGALPLPAAAAAMIERRLAQLGGTALELLRLFALADGAPTLHDAARVLHKPWPELAAAWQALHRAQLVAGQDVAHDLVRECVVAQLPAAVSGALHLALADVLEGQPGTSAARLGEHLRQAGAWSRAAAAFDRAARAARGAGRLQEVETLLERAADCCDRAGDGDQRFELISTLLANRMLRLGPATALASIDEWLPRAASAPQRAALLMLRAQALLNVARFADAERAAAEALHQANPGGGVHFDALTLHGRALALTGRPVEALAGLRQACASPLAAADPAKALHAQAALAHALYASNRLGDAIAAQRDAVAAAERCGDAIEAAQLAGNLAALALRAGDNRLAHESARTAAARFRQLGVGGVHQRFNDLVMARTALHAGRFAEALALLGPLAASDADVPPGDAVRAIAQATMSMAWRWLGDRGRAWAALPASDDTNLAPLALAMLQLARLRLMTGLAERRRALAALRRIARQAPATSEDPMLYCEWSRHVDAAGAAEAVRKLLNLAAASRNAGAPGLANSLEVAAVERLAAAADDAAGPLARRLAGTLRQGMHASTHPAEAWETLARVLDAGGAARPAERCVAAARRWRRSIPGDALTGL